jgi:hypothetical protein
MSRKPNIIEEFIELFKTEPCLWLIINKEYHDKIKKATAYNKLTKKLKELEPEVKKQLSNS